MIGKKKRFVLSITVILVLLIVTFIFLFKGKEANKKENIEKVIENKVEVEDLIESEVDTKGIDNTIVAEKPKEEEKPSGSEVTSDSENPSGSEESTGNSGSTGNSNSGSSSGNTGSTGGGSSSTPNPSPTPQPTPKPTTSPAPTPASEPAPTPTPKPEPEPTNSSNWSTIRNTLISRGWIPYNNNQINWQNNGSVWSIGTNAYGIYLGDYSDSFANEVQVTLSLIFPTEDGTVWGYIQSYSSGDMVKYADGYTIEFYTLSNGAVQIAIY